MKPHEQRVVAEKEDLDQKAERLQTFLEGKPAIDPAELSRLRIQLAIMDAYCQVLAERIAAFAG